MLTVLVPLLAAVVVSAVGLVAIPLVHKQRPGPLPVPGTGPGPDGANVLKVTALGLPGSGKTALLAAMLHTLARPDHHGIRLETDPDHPHRQDQRDLLADLTNRFEDLNGVLPGPTPRGSIARYGLAFGVPQRSDLSSGPPVRLSYLDYSGVLLRDGHRPPGLPDVIATDLAESDIILALVDGAKVAAMMATGPDEASLTELRDLFKILLEYQDKVVHVVLTKWDLLAADGRDPGDVVAWLEQRISRLQELRSADRDSPVRVIPTSAFGRNGFLAASGPGLIRRDPSRSWEPYQADLPLGCAMNEVLGHSLTRLATADGAVSFTPAAVSPFFAWAVKVLGLVTISTDMSGSVQLSLNFNALERYRGLVAGGPAPAPDGQGDRGRSLKLVLRRCRAMADSADTAVPVAGKR